MEELTRDKIMVWSERNACIQLAENFVGTHNVPESEKELALEISRKIGQAIRLRYYQE